ncbi:MAG: aminotransferase class V-fold PLP-dependent enzyme [Acidobacteriota bacterium]
MTNTETSPAGSSLASAWTLETGLDFLNHGSFGACPSRVQQAQRDLRQELETQPVRFMVRSLEARLDAARQRVANFLGADSEGLVPVPNATTGVNTVLRSLTFQPGDQLLTSDHAYNACRNALDFVAGRAGAEVVVVEIPFPGADPDEVLDRFLAGATSRTRLALIDHITSPTGLVLPLEALVSNLQERGIDVLVDGAHGPGMLDLQLDQLGAAYYTGNLHKWVCAPKGAAFLYVREDLRDGIVPLTLSHGYNMPRPGRSRFHDLFDWVGTDDPTPFLCAPTAIDTVASLVPGGWAEARRRNRELALFAQQHLAEALGIPLPCPPSMIGTLAALPLPDSASAAPPSSALYTSPLQSALHDQHRIEVPIVPWPAPPALLIRVSAHVYNSEDQYGRLADALACELFN